MANNLFVDQQWRAILDFPNYEVSNYGNVRHVTRRGYHLRGHRNHRGYWRVSLSLHGKASSRFVHNLVAEAFIGPKPRGKQTNHKDGMKNHNHVRNLEYLTPSENVLHAFSIGLRQRKNSTEPGQYFREANRRHYGKRKSAGLCPRCGSDLPLRLGKSSCMGCAMKMSKSK